MQPIFAQSSEPAPAEAPARTGPCGDGADANWLCELVLDRTGNEILAAIAGSGTTLLAIVLIVIIAFVVSRFLRRSVGRFAARMEARIEERLERAIERGAMSETQRFKTRRLQRLQAISGVLRGVLGVAVWLTALLLIAAELGVPLQPLLAGAGVLSVVIGFGAQQLVRDVLAGIAMLIEDQYGVGDWIEVDGKFGQVERVGLRSTAFRDIDGVVHHVLNGYIQRVGNLSQEWARATFDVPMALDADIPAAKALIYRVASDLAEDPVWGEDIIGAPEVWGVQEFGPDGVKVRIVLPTKPLRNWDVTRQLRERLKFAFEQAGIRQPSGLVDIGGLHTGYAVLTREAPDEEQERQVRRRGLVPPGVGPLDRPPVTRVTDAEDATLVAPPSSAGPVDEADGAAPTVEPRDITTELRIERGPRARPD